MFRKILFWSHLVVGLTATVGIVVMCFTGVLLTYERQIQDWAASFNYVPAAEQSERLPLQELTEQAAAINPDVLSGGLVLDRNPGAPVTFRAGRRGGVELNPYTGETMQIEVTWLRELFSDIIGWHRWFNFSPENRAIPRAIIGWSNILFLLLVVSGLYLWFPAVWKWAAFRMRLLFHRNSNRSAKARDFVWHHVFGFWCAIPLAVLIISGSLFSFDWTDRIVYGAFGTEPPGRQASRVPSGEEAGQDRAANSQGVEADWMSLDGLMESAAGYVADWQELTLTLPRAGQSSVSVLVDRGDGAQPSLRDTLTLDRRSGEIVEVETFSSLPLNQRIRSTNRFLHTGQYFGLIGQTIAGLVSLFALIMVWTGVALAYRRLVVPLLNRRRGENTPAGIDEQEPVRA